MYTGIVRAVNRQELPKLSETALKSFFKLADLWGLEDRDKRVLLGNPSEERFDQWNSGDYSEPASSEAPERISHLLGIHASLKSLFRTQTAYTWIQKPNTADFLNGESALSHMLKGGIQPLRDVHHFLESHCS